VTTSGALGDGDVSRGGTGGATDRVGSATGGSGGTIGVGLPALPQTSRVLRLGHRRQAHTIRDLDPPRRDHRRVVAVHRSTRSIVSSVPSWTSLIGSSDARVARARTNDLARVSASTICATRS